MPTTKTKLAALAALAILALAAGGCTIITLKNCSNITLNARWDDKDDVRPRTNLDLKTPGAL